MSYRQNFSICALRNIGIQTSDHELTISPGSTLHLDFSFMEAQISWIQPMIGSLEWDVLFSGRPVVLIENADVEEGQEHQVLLSNLRSIQAFSSSLWMEKESCVNFERGFNIGIGDETVYVSSSLIHNGFSLPDCQVRETNFSGIEVKSALSMLERFGHSTELDYRKPLAFGAISDRFSLALQHFVRARSSDKIEFKILSFISGFEALFSSATSELAHILSERISLAVFTNSSERISCYRDLKKLYGYRSRIVHGSRIDEKHVTDVIASSRFCDSLARRVVKKFLFDEEFSALINKASTEEFDRGFLELTMGNTN